MNEKKSLANATTTWHGLLILAGIGMITVSIYMTNHYFDSMFPTGLTGASTLCDINSFFNCNKATLSGASNIAGIPISLFGIFVGIFTLLGYMFQSEKAESANYFMLAVNAIGCLVLFVYSLVGLGGLCPMCTVYYIASWIAFFVYFKNVDFSGPSVKMISIYALVVILASGGTWTYVNGKNQYKERVAESMVAQYDGLQNLGKPSMDSMYKLASATEKFEDAPIQIVIFSDFQCPACKMLSSLIHQIIEKYEGKVNIQYFFYPLDHNCNPEMKNPLHPLACQAAYLSYCLPEKFGKVHDDIFNNQDSLSLEWLHNYAKDEKVLDCMKNATTKEKVVDMIKAAGPFGVQSTPTMLLNGVKVEGVIPFINLAPILDALVERHGKK
ncbi:MAG: thioredoxin domain-containing protein [Bacteriovoracaceae bacterium]|nr:thioredoxin domain-containing protein [Bacteriovoracaceae bacterium]